MWAIAEFFTKENGLGIQLQQALPAKTVVIFFFDECLGGSSKL